MKEKFKYIIIGFFEGFTFFIIFPYLFSNYNFGFLDFNFFQNYFFAKNIGEAVSNFIFYGIVSVSIFLLCFYFSKLIGKVEPFLKSLIFFILGVFYSLIVGHLFLIVLFFFSAPKIL
jgi:hypothetical protein